VPETLALPGPVCVVGLGLMGTAIAGRLLDAGCDVRVWNRSPARADPLLARGACWTDDPLGECQLVVVSLYDGAAVRAVMAPWLARSAPGRVVVDTSTVDPATTESLAGTARARGLAWLDAPISGSSVQTARGEATVLIGGPAEDVAALGALWEILGGHWHHVGPTGSASRMKLVTNLVLGLNRAALAEGLVLADVLGIDAQAALDVLRDSPAASRQMETKGPKMVAGDFSVQARLGQHLKDVDLILEAAADAGVTLTLATAHRALLEAAVAAGLGDLDNSAIIGAYRPPGPRHGGGHPT
jgi:3-hydroxyisobutyrate dehydrogenase-like beta-hydroxyacid dehydrogenase